ncbi:hypothetical protein D0Z00_001431 [Geotrichum galactomycetum]|uniref:Uncharacterized protein n=1 Tax=Geotrichum galactomycetum TaxID=27317 RepID=A0ACB6V774_9ASCO|nr:hypothetical protein D0Z00_001431 [Geotrichum candidum]
MDVTDFELLTEDTVSDHVFDIAVNRAPSPQVDLGFVSRRDGEITVQIKVPEAAGAAAGHEKKKRRGKSGSARASSKTTTVAAAADETEKYKTLEVNVIQSMSLLNSNTESSTTGAMLWRVSVVFTEWFYKHIYLPQPGSLLPGRFDVVELGCGAAGLLPITLGSSPKVRQYVATDQPHIVKLARQNVETHYTETTGSMPSNVHVVDYDWEHCNEDIVNIIDKIPVAEGDEEEDNNTGLLILACDVVYNDFLIPYILEGMNKVCETHPSKKISILVAQQVRDPTIMEEFLTQFVEHPSFKVWSVPEHLLNEEFKRGFVLHYAEYQGVKA